MERIVQAAQLLRSRGATRLRLRLEPPHLGTLKVDLTMRQGVLEGRLRAESPEARDLLLSQIERLKESLAGGGVQVGEFHVGVDQSFRQARQQQDVSWTGGAFGGGPDEEPEAAPRSAAPRTGVHRIDVKA
jgi:flagellar hook-length control protein FliK